SGDLLGELPRLAAQAPADETLVIFHSAVLAYLESADRARLTDLVRRLPGRWIRNEGHGVANQLRLAFQPARASGRVVLAVGGKPVANQLPLPFHPARASGRFILAVDGEPRGLTAPHGRESTVLRVS